MDIETRSRGLLCFRDIRADDVRDYRARYRQVYDPIAKLYIASASRCEAGNGDASEMAPTMVPWVVTLIAEHSFGFTLPIGDRFIGSSAFIHGFAHLDPEIYADDDRHVEYLFTWRNLR